MLSGVEFVVYGIVAYGGMIGMVSLVARNGMPTAPEGAGLRLMMVLLCMAITFYMAVGVGTETVTPTHGADIEAGIIWYEETEDLVTHTDTYTLGNYTTTDYGYITASKLRYTAVDPALWTYFHYSWGIIFMLLAFLHAWGMWMMLRTRNAKLGY